jgi:hypothetical protein
MKSLFICSVMLSLTTMVYAADSSDPVVLVTGGRIQSPMLAAEFCDLSMETLAALDEDAGLVIVRRLRTLLRQVQL